MPFKFSYKALGIAGAGAGYAGIETARGGRPGRQGMAAGLGALGLGVGMMFGAPTIGMAVGTGIANLFFQDKRKSITPPKEKNVLLTPESMVSSNAPVPLGFGTYPAAGNILNFKIQRSYDWHNTRDGATPTADEREYFMAIGISVNPATLSSGTIGDLSFQDSKIVTLESFPNGGRSKYPDSARSDYYCYQSKGSTPYYKSWDTGWVTFFSANNGVIYFHFGKDTDPSWWEPTYIDAHSDVYIHKRVNGEETITKLETSDWTDDAQTIYYVEENVVAGEYKITWDFDDDLDTAHNYTLTILKDNTTFTSATRSFTEGPDIILADWVYQCNWFLLKFDDDNFAPENSDFQLICNQGESNPIANLRSYLTDQEWGRGIPDDKIDDTTWDALEATCTTEGRTFNGLFTSQTAPSDIITQFLITAKALMVYSEGKFKLIEDKFSEPTKAFEETNTIADSFQYTQKDVNAMISRLKVDFEDSEHDYKVRSILLDDIDLIDKIGIKDTSQFLMGVNTETQAEDIGDYLFRNLRQPNTATWKVSINDADIEPGQMVEVIRPAVQYGGVFRVVDTQEESNDEIQVSGISYFPNDEIITISTEDDFRAGTLENCEIARTEDGEVDALLKPYFILEMTSLPTVVGGPGDELVELSYTGVVGVCAGAGDYRNELSYSGLVGVTVTL